MRVEMERRLLQGAVALACVVPITAGLGGALRGAPIAGGLEAPIDLDSHLRYLSGLLLGIGFAFLSCIPAIEARGRTFRLLGAIVVVGGIARALGLLTVGAPGLAHQLALAMELGTVPLLMLWQARVERRWRDGLQPRLAETAPV